VVRGGQRRAALEDLRGSRGAADESPRGFVEASVVGSSHRLRLELSIICGLVFGGRDARGRPSGRECSRRPLSATHGRERPESNTAHKQRATGHNRQFIAHAQIRQAPGNRRQAEQGYRTQVLRIAPATGTAAAHPPQARTRFPPHPGPREAPRCHDQHKLTQQTPGRGDPETSCQEQKPRSEA
jgi:hypothetical protein